MIKVDKKRRAIQRFLCIAFNTHIFHLQFFYYSHLDDDIWLVSSLCNRLSEEKNGNSNPVLRLMTRSKSSINIESNIIIIIMLRCCARSSSSFFVFMTINIIIMIANEYIHFTTIFIYILWNMKFAVRQNNNNNKYAILPAKCRHWKFSRYVYEFIIFYCTLIALPSHHKWVRSYIFCAVLCQQYNKKIKILLQKHFAVLLKPFRDNL